MQSLAGGQRILLGRSDVRESEPVSAGHAATYEKCGFPRPHRRGRIETPTEACHWKPLEVSPVLTDGGGLKLGRLGSTLQSHSFPPSSPTGAD